MSICVFGIFVADLCFFSDNIPIKGQTILGKKHIIGPGGKGSNQAIAAARSGGKVSFITKLGKDNYSDLAISLYKEAKINFDGIQFDPINSTGAAGIMINENTGEIWIEAGEELTLRYPHYDPRIEGVKTIKKPINTAKKSQKKKSNRK